MPTRAREHREQMPRATPRLNYYFQPCEVVTPGGMRIPMKAATDSDGKAPT